MSRAVEINDLKISIPQRREDEKELLRGVNLQLQSGESLALVGESGSGKSITARSILGMFPRGAKVSGSVKVDGTEIVGASSRELRRVRRSGVAMIFQDPRAHINPVRTVGHFLTETLIVSSGWSRKDAEECAAQLLRDVGIPNAKERLNQYPHQLSGGLLQRVMIAGALADEPAILLADEPTTALDVTTQEEVMAILMEMRQEKGLAMLFITHDLELAAATCDHTAVMYKGRVLEVNTSKELHDSPEHPYTVQLLAARPSVAERRHRLPVVDMSEEQLP
ncbi:ABC transporter ATP-binding protein [Nesterenkonia muleiensis]|uniref:ABC transporter ATP-binding protein n=1 Tax=Nesterenkonia muleiensis TaxID=2282648 RepID=UPI000E71C043|nr:ABC transporter ATP-binding protein [Nesterenkonia muleiensis]